MEYCTADLCDLHSEKIRVASAIGFKDYGGKKMFGGKIHTIKCYEDHSYVEKAVKTDGTGKVLIVDAGGSDRCAVMGDRLAGLAVKNNWNGVIIYGCIRDSVGIGRLPLGVKALNTIPLTKETGTVWDEEIPVHFADVTFTPGHFVFADEDGIVISENEDCLPHQ